MSFPISLCRKQKNGKNYYYFLSRSLYLVTKLVISSFLLHHLTQATIVVVQHPSNRGIRKGFQTTIHIGGVRQTALIEGIFAKDSLLANETGSVVFRFLNRPEFVKKGMSLLFRDGGRTKGVGIITQIFPLVKNLF